MNSSNTILSLPFGNEIGRGSSPSFFLSIYAYYRPLSLFLTGSSTKRDVLPFNGISSVYLTHQSGLFGISYFSSLHLVRYPRFPGLFGCI